MEWLLSLLPVALVVLVCGGLHMIMMRGMHGGHDVSAGHGGHLPAADPDRSRPGERLRGRALQGDQEVAFDNNDRVAELERQVAELQQEIDMLLTDPAAGDRNGGTGRVIALHRGVGAWRNDSETEPTLGD